MKSSVSFICLFVYKPGERLHTAPLKNLYDWIFRAETTLIFNLNLLTFLRQQLNLLNWTKFNLLEMYYILDILYVGDWMCAFDNDVSKVKASSVKVFIDVHTWEDFVCLRDLSNCFSQCRNTEQEH